MTSSFPRVRPTLYVNNVCQQYMSTIYVGKCLLFTGIIKMLHISRVDTSHLGMIRNRYISGHIIWKYSYFRLQFLTGRAVCVLTLCLTCAFVHN